MVITKGTMGKQQSTNSAQWALQSSILLDEQAFSNVTVENLYTIRVLPMQSSL